MSVYRATINGKRVVVEADGHGDWILVQNYEHYGGENPTPSEGTTFPTLPNGYTTINDVQNLGTSGELRHVDNINQFGTWNVDAVRLHGETSNHTRTVHYFTTDATVIADVEDNSANAHHTDLRNATTYYTDHDANLPDTASSNSTDARSDRIFEYGFPMFEGGAYHWAVKGNGSRWEMDDYPDNASKTTIHRVWARKSGGVNGPTGATGLDGAAKQTHNGVCRTY